MVQLCDILDANMTARICRDGSLVADVRAARVGIQTYLGAEVDPDGSLGLRDKAAVRVYRPESEVFSTDSMASYAAAPFTIDHPTTPVDSSNWRDLGVGEVNGDVVRDGGFVRVPVIVRDAVAVEKVRTTHKQLSMGYSCTLDATPGTTPEGQTYDAVQRQIRINHIAAVPAARGGPELKISDERTAPSEKSMSTITIDGLPVNLGDEAAVRAVIAKKDAAIATADKALADATATVSILTGEKAVLEKDLADAKADLEPAKIDARVADRSAIVAKAKSIKADIVTDGKADADIRREVVAAKLGDAAAALDDAAIAGAFAMATADAKLAVTNISPRAHVTTDAAASISTLRAARYA